MAPDDLNTPLGQNRRQDTRQDAPHDGSGPKPSRVPVMIIAGAVGGLLALSLLVFASWALFAENPFGGEPAAVAALGGTKEPDNGGGRAARHYEGTAQQAPTQAGDASSLPAASGGKSAQQSARESPNDGQRTVTIIDGTSGERKEIVLHGPGPSSGATSPAPGKPESSLLETTPEGAIPRIAPDGTRPSRIYAQPMSSPVEPHTPRIAIVFTGLGTGARSTAMAMTLLPAPVTFAFVPYSSGLSALAARARKAGHEILLQVPMEPFDYPENDTGPQTLLTSANTDQNIARLHWTMARMQGYVGLSSLAGARFTASEKAMEPVLQETARRGLIYFDDGTATRSVGSAIAAKDNIAFAKADLVIDATATPVEIDHALKRLELIARKNGTAIGTAHALPASIEHVANWAEDAKKRGFVLVPITAAAAKEKSS